MVAVDAHSGEYRWHFQTIRHDLWDADPPAPPVLFDIEQDGPSIPALGVTTKSGYLYILNRENGEPIFGVEERPVPASDVPGEATYPTQPFPVKPPPMGRVAYEPADLVTADDTSAEHAAACAELVASLGEIHSAGPFTPWAYRPEGAPPRTTLNFPGGVGGPNWARRGVRPGLRLSPGRDTERRLRSAGWWRRAAMRRCRTKKPAPRPASFDVAVGGRAAPAVPETALGRADRGRGRNG